MRLVSMMDRNIDLNKIDNETFKIHTLNINKFIIAIWL